MSDQPIPPEPPPNIDGLPKQQTISKEITDLALSMDETKKKEKKNEENPPDMEVDIELGRREDAVHTPTRNNDDPKKTTLDGRNDSYQKFRVVDSHKNSPRMKIDFFTRNPGRGRGGRN